MRIAIVGGGATGALAALHLSRAIRQPFVEIVIVEPAAEVGRGLAYRPGDQHHLLNVRVGNMSAFAEEPDHLFHWLEDRGALECATPFCFIPRGLYGRYLASLVEGPILDGRLRHIRDICVDLSECDQGVRLSLQSGPSEDFDLAILATGNPKRLCLRSIPSVQAWTDDTLRAIDNDKPVLLVGSGLTMVDQVLSLARRGHREKITALSHHGLLPTAHRAVNVFSVADADVPFGAELSVITKWVRRLVLDLNQDGSDWRLVIDALRPHTQKLWRNMTLAQRSRFLRHLRAYWDVLRHRMAPEVEEEINALREAGRLEIVAGRIESATANAGDIMVAIRKRGADSIFKSTFGRVIDCRGASTDFGQSHDELIGALLARGTACLDPLGIGLLVSDDYSLVNCSSRKTTRIRVVGPLARATFWECTAIPDIRAQCAHLAELIASYCFVEAQSAARPGRNN
jgi:uncharacterized NAD(P)/FAD-binding protein YdhS